ncbi:sensor histidine kinase [Kribbella catacumbae]|uniref:sensor histidine kinase n=1 Tax=Kribbella catacumbae TaxID=460086 RepID=UPI000361C78F|nr:sensor histidine kinase [Kribbella catacumbae]
MESVSSASWLSRMVRAALRGEPSGSLDDLVGVIGQATGASSVILWEAVHSQANPAVPSVLAIWTDGARSAPTAPARADSVTLAAFAHRSLAIPLAADESSTPAADGHRPAMAALPVDFLDGGQGVLTLHGGQPLGNEAFDLAVDLLEVLPELCSVVRDRQTLDLVNLCDGILREAEFETSLLPLDRDLLAGHLKTLCEAVGQSLRCADVSIYLHEPGEAEQPFPLVATSSEKSDHQPVHVRRAGVAGQSVERGGPNVEADQEEMVAQLATGEHIWGLISCSGLHGPPFHFTPADLSLLVPVGSLVAQHWSNWLQRRMISAEIESWRRLAAAITGLNKLVADELKRDAPRDELIYEKALSIVQDVVQDCTGAGVHRTVSAGSNGSRLERVLATGSPRAGAAVNRRRKGETSRHNFFAGSVHRSKSQLITTEDQALADEGLDRPVHWLIGTPISVGEKFFGVLEAFGPSREVPANSAQVCEIVGDQIGLYQHLQESLRRLHETRQHLQVTNRGQAEALEDLEHQLVSPLIAATSRTELVLKSARFDSKTELQLRAIRGLCRKASRVAMSAGVFAALSKGASPKAKVEVHGADDLLRMLIAAADDAQMLSNPRRRIGFDVDRASIQGLGRRLVSFDNAFLEQCIGNILDNAAKYSYEQTRVEISGLVTEEVFAVAVTSTGLALQAEDAVLALQRNWRGARARNSTGEGSGLGLWIVDNLMRSMQATIDIIPADERTTVRLSLPLADQTRPRRS